VTADQADVHVLERFADRIELLTFGLDVANDMRGGGAGGFGGSVGIDHRNAAVLAQPALDRLDVGYVGAGQDGFQVRQRHCVEVGRLSNEPEHHAPGGKMSNFVGPNGLECLIRHNDVVVHMQVCARRERKQHVHEKDVEVQRRKAGAYGLRPDIIHVTSAVEELDDAAMIDDDALGSAGRAGGVDAVCGIVQLETAERHERSRAVGMPIVVLQQSLQSAHRQHLGSHERLQGQRVGQSGLGDDQGR
jgi:hypothetical protein